MACKRNIPGRGLSEALSQNRKMELRQLWKIAQCLLGFCRDELGRVVLGDVITAIDGKEIKLQRDLFEILDERRPGDKIKLEVLRNGQTMAFEVELGGRQLSGTE